MAQHPVIRNLLPALGLFLSALPLASQPPATPNIRHIHFQQTDTLFQNPGQGWMLAAGRNQSPRFPTSVYYLRRDWQVFEPADGVFDWSTIDAAIANARSTGATVAIRIMTANAHSQGYYSSPKWLFDQGCKGYEYTTDGADPSQGGKPQPRIEPDYADPIYLRKHAEFLQALGKRYNGSPDIEFLDIGSYGIWGEWHTTHPASVAVRQQIVDMYLHAFDKTPLVFMSDDADVMAYALAHGAGLRRDGVGDPWHESRWAGTPAYAQVPAMGDAWLHAPIVFEWYLNYAYLIAKGWSFSSAVDFMLRNHVTFINDNLGPVPAEAMPQLERLARLAGYRFVLRDLAVPQSVTRGTALPLSMVWANVGVGKLYRTCRLTLSLRDRKDREVASAVAPSDPQDWLPGDRTIDASLPLPAKLKSGTYTLKLAILDAASQRPPIHLAIDAPEDHGWYTVDQITIH